MIDQILFTWNRSYLAPTFEEAQELSTLLDSTCAVLGPHRCNDLAFAMAAYGVETVTATEMSAEMADVVLPQPRGALKRLREAWRRRQ